MYLLQRGEKNQMKKANAKSTKKLITLILAALIFIGGSLYGAFDDEWREVVKNESATENVDNLAPFEVHFIDVGQGDCILIECEGENMLIDCGDNAQLSKVKRYLSSENVSEFKYIVATHAHSDHIGGMAEILDAYKTDIFITSKIPKELTPTTQSYIDMLTSLKNNNVNAVYAKSGSAYNLASATFTIIGPVRDDCDDLNNTSVIIRLDYGKHSFLFQGDAEKEEESDVLGSGADIKADVIKIGHHGSKTSSIDDYLSKVKANDAVISVGASNQYSLPAKSILKRLKSFDMNIYRTDISGNIVYSGDKNKIEVRIDK